MKKRSYKITFGLQEGYAPDSRVHTLHFAGKLIHDWMAERLADNEPVVAGFLQEGILFFPAVDAKAKDPVTASPSAVFTGELLSPGDLERTHKEVRQTLESLATALKKGLKQESVYIIYLDKNWCV